MGELHNILKQILKAAARLFLARSMGFPEFVAIAKEAFVEATEEAIKQRGQKASDSRISVVSGLNRNDISRIRRGSDTEAPKPYNLLSRVLAHWQTDQRFLTKQGKPRVLSLASHNNEFERLVSAVSQHLHPGTVIAELERVGAIGIDGEQATLKTTEYYRTTDQIRGLELLAKDVDYIVRSVKENLDAAQSINLHIHTEYDNLFIDSLDQIRSWVLDEGKVFHRKIREFLSQFDADVNPSSDNRRAAGGRMSVTAFSLSEKNPQSKA